MSVLPFPSHRTTRAAEPDGQSAVTLRQALGEVLRDERHAQQRTLAEVAGGAAVSLAYLSEVERGRKDVSSDVLTSISGALDLPLPVLLERTARRITIRATGTFALAA